MRFWKKVIVVFLTRTHWMFNKLGRIMQWDDLILMYRYAKWKARLKYLGPYVKFYHGIIIHNPKKVSIKGKTRLADYVHMWGGGGIEIGENVIIGSHTEITSLTHDTQAMKYTESLVSNPIYIEDNVWIGTHVVILPGIHIGRNAIIGAGAVVTRDVAPNTVVVGVPARPIRTKGI